MLMRLEDYVRSLDHEDLLEWSLAVIQAVKDHRDEVECCRECSEAVIADRSTADGRLWRFVGL